MSMNAGKLGPSHRQQGVPRHKAQIGLARSPVAPTLPARFFSSCVPTMTEVPPNFASVKQGLIPVTPQERLKLEKDGLDVVHDIYRYAKTGFASIEEGDFDRMKWYGVYRQKPKDSGYFMMRTKVPGGQLTAVQAKKLSELGDR